MESFSDRFRNWYTYERDCNAKSLAMLSSVPAESRTHADFQKAVDKMAHLAAARLRWLHRLGHYSESPDGFPKNVSLSTLEDLVKTTEAAWTTYMNQLSDNDLNERFEWMIKDKRVSWDVESALMQMFGHAWYHRGQIAMLVAQLGGTAVDTDYYFWNGPTPMESERYFVKRSESS
jgi:uncharacterized damage-inducible protein DinB